MIKSMTGYGTASYSDTDLSVFVEVKCLNSKFMDLAVRLPRSYAEVESEWRNLISDRLERGKVSFSVEVARTGKSAVRHTFNKELFVAYYSELRELADAVRLPSLDPLFSIAVNSPDVMQANGRESLPTEEKDLVMRLVSQALDKCDRHRMDEGRTLESKFREYLSSIGEALQQVIALDPIRVERVRNRLTSGIQEVFGQDAYDANRLEQEMIFHIEKLDIHEEQVRLQAHLDYFLTVLNDPQSGGKKLGFLAQEIGREINTIGAKANDAAIQVHVVRMKEELEKIKEQLNNVL